MPVAEIGKVSFGLGGCETCFVNSMVECGGIKTSLELSGMLTTSARCAVMLPQCLTPALIM